MTTEPNELTERELNRGVLQSDRDDRLIAEDEARRNTTPDPVSEDPHQDDDVYCRVCGALQERLLWSPANDAYRCIHCGELFDIAQIPDWEV